MALAHFRSTPRQDGVSPAQLFLQRRIRINLPVLSKHLAPMNSELMGEALTQRNSALQKSRSTRDQKCKPLALLEPGEKVLVQNDSSKLWDTKGFIVSRREDGRSYTVKNSDGSIQLRNRRHLWPVQGGDIDLPALKQSHPGSLEVYSSNEVPGSSPIQVNSVTWEPLTPKKMDPKKSKETLSKGGKGRVARVRIPRTLGLHHPPVLLGRPRSSRHHLRPVASQQPAQAAPPKPGKHAVARVLEGRKPWVC